MKRKLLALSLAFSGLASAQTWQDVGGGLNSSSHGMCLWNNMLIDGGSFGSPCGRVAGWNGTSWICFGNGVGIVARAVIEFNGDLIVCGDFWNVQQPCVDCNGIAKWDGTSWTPLGTGFNNDVLCMTVWNGQLVAGGDFTQADGNPSDRVAVWNGTNWYSLGGFDTTFNNDVRALAVYNGELWAGGDFTNAGGCSPCDRIVKWNGTAWVGGNSGVDIPGGLDSTVRVLYVNPSENKLYLGGHFLDVGGNTACSRVAVYDGSVWSPLGTGVDNYVRAIHAYNGNVIVGGDFLNASGTPASKIAKWNPNTSTWSAMGSGMNDYVKAMGVYNGEFYAGGPFTTADGLPRSCVAKWYEVPALPPVAAFTASSNAICLNQCISLTDNSTNTPTSWNWTFTGATPGSSTQQNPTNICYNTAGTYTITLQACNSNGCSTTSQTITVSSVPQPVVNVSSSPSSVICSGGSATLTATGASTYAWSPATGLSATTGASVTASPTVTTTYTVTGNSSGCTDVDSITVTVNPVPTIIVSPSAVTVCPSGSAPLTASGGNTYAWTPATGLSATTGANVTASPTATTTYTIIGTAVNGCTASATSIVSVGSGQSLPLVEGFQSLPFLPTGWTMIDDGTDGNTWERNTTVGGFSSTGSCAWYNNNAINAPGTRDEMRTVSLNFLSLSTAQMTFDVAYCRRTNASLSDTLVVLASTDCGNSWTQVYSKGGTTLATAPNQNSAFTPTTTQWRTETVNLNSFIGQPVVMFAFQNRNSNGNNLYLDNINISGTTANPPVTSFSMNTDTICPGQCVTFTDNTTGLPTSWSWTFTNGTPASSTSQNPGSVCWNAPGVYAVTLQACNSNGCNPYTQNVVVYVPNASAGADDTICTGGNTPLLATGGVSYVWSPATGLSCVSCANPIANPTATTVYTVTVTDVNGCTNTDSVEITVMLCTGVTPHTTSPGLHLFPNPFSSMIILGLDSPGMVTFYNSLGVEVKSRPFAAGTHEVDLSGLAAGIYFLQWKGDDGATATKKLLKQ